MSEETAVAVREPKVPLESGKSVAAMVPTTLEEAYRLSTAISASGLAPSSFKTAEQILVAILAGAEIGYAPIQALQSIAVINGKPTLYGDGLIALPLRAGFKIKEWREGEGEAMIAWCSITRPDNGEVFTRSFSVDDAKKAKLWGKKGQGGQDTPWITYPERMLQMRARAWAIRDGAADVLRGFQVREEVEDYQNFRDVTPEKSGVMSRLPGASEGEGFSAKGVDEALGISLPVEPDVIEAEIEEAQPEPEPEAPAPVEAPADDLFPGDKPLPAANTADLLKWADEMERDLPDYAGSVALRADYDARGEALTALDRSRGLALKGKVMKRIQALKGEGL